MKRSHLRSVSDRRLAESDQRKAVRWEVIQRDGGCVWHQMGAAALGPAHCWGGIEVHEILSRARGGDYLNPDNCVTLCSRAHQFITRDDAGAEAVGLALPSWPTLDRPAALLEALRIRARRRQHLRAPFTVPSWRAGDEFFASRAQRDLEKWGWTW